jgi:hypothetical protein
MSIVAVHAMRNGLLDFHGRPVNVGRISYTPITAM